MFFLVIRNSSNKCRIGGAALIRGRRLLTFLSQMRRLFEGGAYSRKYGNDLLSLGGSEIRAGPVGVYFGNHWQLQIVSKFSDCADEPEVRDSWTSWFGTSQRLMVLPKEARLLGTRMEWSSIRKRTSMLRAVF